jgi:hypothetical protein
MIPAGENGYCRRPNLLLGKRHKPPELITDGDSDKVFRGYERLNLRRFSRFCFVGNLQRPQASPPEACLWTRSHAALALTLRALSAERKGKC